MAGFKKLYQELKRKNGGAGPQWRLWRKRKKTEKDREEIIIGAILTQRTNWKNVELAIGNLKDAKINSLSALYRLGRKNKKKLAVLIKPSGFYRAKADYLFALTKFIIEKYGGIAEMKNAPLRALRKELLAQKGVGPETADSILLYALDKPIFVIDEYTRRFVKERGLCGKLSYDALQKLFQKNLPKSVRTYQDFHALIVTEGKMARS